ncbi:uncharacterized protein N0V89_005536 [Didymosphaeria variabile]|uniref:Uncharacterized protein n=1 Tax=Didymosphaeria variabile TaxID=1932322 RepID=A0A9W8XL68_9PLEO|nr:uncharacterized protein N0V89_005536 [Didymosphaeria variabile]KAJ4353806.1 hypothetical protein N0V89_005536 [Didymosphaeria variabile]
MRTAGLVVALGGLFNVAFANVVCNTEAVHSKPRIISVAEKDGFANTIEEVCSTTDSFSESRSGSTVFTITGTDEDLGSDDCEAQFHSIIEQCVAGHNFGGGRLIATDGLTLEVSTTDAENHALEARRSRGGSSRTSRTRTKKTRPKKTKKTKTKKTKKTKTKKPKTTKPKTTKPKTTKPKTTKPKTTKPKTKKPTTKKPKTKKPTSCPLPKKKTGIKRFVPDFVLKRAGSSAAGAAGCSVPEEVDASNAFKSLAKDFPNAKNGEFYKFTSKSPFTEPGPNETEDELKALQRALGFDHIAVVVGEVKITERITGKGANKKKIIKKDFAGSIIDLIKKTSGAAEYREKVFAPKKVFTLHQGAKTSKAKAAKAKAKGKEYFVQAAHKEYSVSTNNCNTFAQDLLNDI